MPIVLVQVLGLNLLQGLEYVFQRFFEKIAHSFHLLKNGQDKGKTTMDSGTTSVIVDTFLEELIDKLLEGLYFDLTRLLLQ